MMLALLAVAMTTPLPPAVDPPEIAQFEAGLPDFSRDNFAYRREASRLLEMRLGAWSKCIVYYRNKFLKSVDDPDYVATAILVSCADHEPLIGRAADHTLAGLLNPTSRQARASEMIQSAREDFRAGIIAYIVKAHLDMPDYIPRPKSRIRRGP